MRDRIYTDADVVVEENIDRLAQVEEHLGRALSFREKYELSILYTVGDVIHNLNPQLFIEDKNAIMLMKVQTYFLNKKILKED
jgi:hypothetical protein